MPLSELPSSLREWAADIAFIIVFLTCSVSVSWELIHIPRYLMHFAGARGLISSIVLVGMVIDGLGPEFHPLLDLVKCISSHLISSVLWSLVCSYSWTTSQP